MKTNFKTGKKKSNALNRQNRVFASGFFLLLLVAVPFAIADGSAVIQPSPKASISLECPIPNIDQNLTSASAYYYLGGVPTVDDNLVLNATFNQTSQQLVGVVDKQASTGKHAFLFNTKTAGPYHLVVTTADRTVQSNGCDFVLFGKEPTKVAELPLPLILVLLLISVLTLKSKNQTSTESAIQNAKNKTVAKKKPNTHRQVLNRQWRV